MKISSCIMCFYNMSGSLDEEEHTTISIIINGKPYDIPRTCVKYIKVIETVLHNDPTATNIEFTLPNTVCNPDRVMNQIMEYVVYHNIHGGSSPIAKPLVSEKLKESGVSPWDIAFIDKTDEELTDLASSANYLHAPELLELCCAKIGSIMKHIMNQYPEKEDQQRAVRKRWRGE